MEFVCIHVNKMCIVIYATYTRSGWFYCSFYEAINVQDYIGNNELEN
jgi:hypothetical protein